MKKNNDFDNLSGVIGRRAAEKFCRNFVDNYRKAYIKKSGESTYAAIIGDHAADLLVATFGGELLYLPSFKRKDLCASKKKRDKAIRFAARKVSFTTIANISGLCRRQIIRIKKTNRRGVADTPAQCAFER